MARTISIRTGLLLSVFALIGSFGILIVATTTLGAREAVETLSRRLIRRNLGEITAHLQAFFNPAQDGIRVAAAWGEAGRLDLDDPAGLRELLDPILRQYPQITSLMVADENGREFMLLRLGARWRNRETRADTWGPRARWREWSDERPEPKEHWDEKLGYDARRRPWFRDAMARRGLPEAERLNWTHPYEFFTTKDPGITASVAFPAPDGRWMVVAFDVMLKDISKKTIELGRTDETRIFVLTDDDRVIGLPYVSQDRLKGKALLRAEDLHLQEYDDAREIVEELPDPVRYASGGEWWWGDKEKFTLGTDRTFQVTVLIPESQMLAAIARIRTRILAITAGLLVLALLGSLLLARRFSRPVERLVAESERISRGDLDPGKEVVTRIAELHELAGAQERMRASLHKLFKLEGDLRIARQIQRDTWPERLPELDGFQLCGWSEPADETGGDTYDVVGISGVTLCDGKAERAVLLLADATGHGIGPALSAAQARAMLRMAVRTGHDVAEIARQMNEQLCEDLEAARFVTAWFGHLDAAEKTLATFSAGQGPLLRYDAAQDRWDELGANMPPLGVLSGVEIELPEPIVMGPGDVYAVLSDGFFEAAAPGGELFETARVVAALTSAHRGPPEEMLRAVRTAVDDFTKGAPAADDRTAVIVKRVG